MPESTIILGIDPGTWAMGYGLVSQNGTHLRHIHSGVILAKKKDPLEKRLLSMYRGLKEVILQFAPSHASIETVFTFKNVRSTVTLSHSRGVALLVCAEYGIKVAEYSPMEIKLCTVGYGRASKDQVSVMVKKLFGLSKVQENPKQSDSYDALAIAFCHLQNLQTQTKLSKYT